MLRMSSNRILIWICIIYRQFLSVQANEAILMDTRTATSDVGWVMPQGSEWQEANSPYPDGSEPRMLMVCKMRKAKQNNWVRTPYIPVEGAQRVYVEFEFTMRSCEDVENVATCKETFNLYYYETDRDEATTTFPPWEEGTYTKVDTIAADKRFRPGSQETNFETRDIGPLTKNGIYLALQDTGACMALMHLRVYYKYCAPTWQNFAQFSRTICGPEKTSLVESQGTCVNNAFVENGVSPSLYCNSDGEWNVPKGECVCGAGFDPNLDRTSCKACGQGHYKATIDNRPCTRCPAYSHSREYGATICDCMYGYFRTSSDGPSSPCTKPPSKPLNLRIVVNQTDVVLTWDRPFNDGGRDDLTYRVECSRCQPGFIGCRECSPGLDYLPMQENLLVPKVEVEHLSAFAYYKFKVHAMNGVSGMGYIDDDEPSYAEVTIETNQAAPSKVTGLHAIDVTSNSFLITWEPPAKTNGKVNLYQVVVTDDSDSVKENTSTQTQFEAVGLKDYNSYVVKVRAKTKAGYGPYSAPLVITTKSIQTSPPSDERSGTSVNTLFYLVAAIGGFLIIIIVVIVIFYCKRKSNKYRKSAKIDLEKYPMFHTSTLMSNGSYPLTQKTYIDPTTYEDPQRAVLDFTKEIEASYVSIEEVIGGGEFGEVCRGNMRIPSSKEEHDVAIKTLKTGYSTQQKLDFLGEASIMGQFEHPNVIRLEGVVTKSRPLMIITEYMENGSLDSFLRNHDGEFTVIQLVGMLRNIAAGMKYLSDMGYVHRDLAARNILVNAQLICKVSDFGLSRVLEDDGDATYTTRGGKIPIRWTAPEAITYRKFTSASDVWSYGIVMWEVMSYGERPYWGMSNQDVIQAVGTGYRLPAPMDCPLVQHQLMVECWKKNRNERPKFSQIVTSLDRMLREPSQLKAIAGQDENCNGHLAAGIGSMSHLSHCEEKRMSAPLLGAHSSSDVSVSGFIRPHSELPSFGAWLDSIGLGAYKDGFIRNGCNSFEQLVQLKPSDLARLGLSNANHQNILLDSIYSIGRGKERYPGNPPSYKDDRITGIPV